MTCQNCKNSTSGFCAEERVDWMKEEEKHNKITIKVAEVIEEMMKEHEEGENDVRYLNVEHYNLALDELKRKLLGKD